MILPWISPSPVPVQAIPEANDNLIKWLTLITLAVGLVVLFWRYVGAPVRREWLADRNFNRRFREDWDGTEVARPGHGVRPGVMQSLEALRADGATNAARLAAAEAILEQHTHQIRALRADFAALRPALLVTREDTDDAQLGP